MWDVKWDGDYVVGGDGNRRLTPNFRLKEFQTSAGPFRVHRELVSALQLLRNRFGRSLSIESTDDDGLGVTLSCHSVPDLLRAVDVVQAHHLFKEVVEGGTEVKVRIPDPSQLSDIDLEQVLETAFSVTSAFETSGDRFQQVTGNFDGAGLSFGPAQWNFGSGTLVPLFREFQRSDETALRGCFEDATDYEEWTDVMEQPTAQQIEWADGISTGRGKQVVVQPWKGYFQAVGRLPAFRAVMVEQSLRKYGTRLLKQIKYLQRLRPDVQIDHLRCICALYDLVIQQGSLNKAHAQIEDRIKREDPKDQFALVEIAVRERGKKANSRWVSDVLSRRLSILRGVPTTVDGTQRANINFYMLRDVRIRGAKELMNADAREQVAQVSLALASGDSLLA